MTDDELSELEEFIDHCMRVAPVAGAQQDRSAIINCPMVMVARVLGFGLSDTSAAFRLGIDYWRFTYGFDLSDPVSHRDAQMGRRFRERVIAGEYAR